ncbi:MAG TPA: glycosyltransferase [Candidatus Saccharimonadales bacterium]|nr:glycosyltransferase [Candidatus Saccharimonadales bacterium]
MPKRIALVHDYIKEYGGAEKVLETLHDMYPEAPVFTLVYCPEFLGPHKERFTNWDIRTSFLQYLPFKHKFISIFRLIAPFIFKAFDFADFEIIIVSATGAYNPNMIEKKNAKQICYCHTPPRYLYGYATAREWKKNIFMRILGETANHFLRLIDYRSAQNVDQFIANSENIKKRIEKFYRKNAIVVYPPAIKKISVKSDELRNKKREYYLAGGRLARAKHYDLIMKACAQLGVALTIFGKGFAGYEEELHLLHTSLGKENSRFLGEVPDDEKFTLMRNAKAFIFAGEDEDFGIMPVEAMSVGTPVIAYKSGGVLETVSDGKTGIFFDALTVASLVSAIKKFEKVTIKAEDCIKQAEKFSEERFKESIKKLVLLE